MAKGMNCPDCDYYMVAIDEDDEPMGSWVVYECRACRKRIKVFERK